MHTTALRYFLEVARAGSISQASEKLHVAVSAISRQIARLESELGTPLFERRPRGMVLSNAGQVLAAHARRATLEAECVIDEIRGLAAVGRHTIRVSSSEGAARDFLPHMFARFRAVHAETKFQLHVAPPDETMRRVRDGDADIGMTFSMAPEKGIRVEYAERAPIFALVNRRHPLARRGTVSLAELRDYPLALVDEGTTIRQLFDICCSLEGLLFEPVYTSNYSASLAAMVRWDDAVTLTGYLTVRDRLDAEGLAAVPITNPQMHQRTIQVQTMAGRTLPATVRAFLDLLIDGMRTYAAPTATSIARHRELAAARSDPRS